LRLRLRASPVLTALTIGLHGSAAAVLWSVLPAGPGSIVAILICILGTLAVARRTLLSAASAPALLELKRDGSLGVRLRGGAEIGGLPAERRYVTRWLVVLELAGSPLARRTIVVARDMLAPAEFRHLRLWALWRALPEAPPAAGA
jgi:hypothetical protein